MAAAHEARGDPDAVMAMIVQPGERNAYDQQARGFVTRITVAPPVTHPPSDAEAWTVVMCAPPCTAAA